MTKKQKKRGARKFTIPLAPIAGIIAAPAVREMADKAMLGHVDGVLVAAGKFVGVKDGKFNAGELGANILPIIIGCMVHKFVGGPPLNLNRMLAAANVPVIRI